MKGREFLKITRKFLSVVIAMVCTVSVFYGVQTVSAVEVIQETECSVSTDSLTDTETFAEEPTQQPTEAPTEQPTEPMTLMSTSPIYTEPIATSEPARYYTVIDGDITYHVATAYGGGDSAEVYNCSDDATDVVILDEVDGLPVRAIALYAFDDCDSLTSIVIPDSVKSVRASYYGGTDTSYAKSKLFEDCSSLTDVTLGGLDMAYGSYFENCPLKNLTFGNGTTYIPSGAFKDFVYLENVTIPETVKSIGQGAFSGTPMLENQSGPLYYVDKWLVDCDEDAVSIEIKDDIKYAASSAFYGCSKLENITIGAGITDLSNIPYYSYGDSKLKEINVSKNNTEFASIDGVLFNKDCTKLIRYPAAKENISYVIPDSVESIATGYDGAFAYCRNLETIMISDGITEIRNRTFYGCSSLKNINIPNNVKSIGDEVFYKCKSLTNITISDGVKSIGMDAFYGCNRLKFVEIPKTAESIGTKAFGFSSLDEKIDNFVIYGTENSTAEDYALDYGFVFVDVDKPVTISTKSFSLSTGKTQVLEVNNFAGEVEWYSDNEDVATVNNGYVRAVGCGTANIYVIAGNEKLSCSVTVSDNPSVTTAVSTTPVTTKSTTLQTFTTPPKSTSPLTHDTDITTSVKSNIHTETTASTTVSSVITTSVSTAATTVTTPFETYIVKGDANGDGHLRASDAAFIAKALAEASINGKKITVEDYPAADFNQDGKLTAADAAAIAKYLAELSIKK